MPVARVEVVVLGLLAEESLHGYELWERFRGRAMGLWAGVGRASVYQALKRLETTGRVAGKATEGLEGPDRRVYRITRPGRDRLRQGILERFGDLGTDAAVALGLAHLVSADDARKGVIARERGLAALLTSLDAERERLSHLRGPGNALAGRMVERRAVLARAELEWLAGFRKDLGRLRR